MTEYDYAVGDIVVDKEDENPDKAVVVRKTDMRIKDWEVESGTTVFDTNPECDEDEDTVLVGFKDYLDEQWPEWEDVDDPEDLYYRMVDKGLKWYCFPESRLVPEEGDIE